jgi:hypothetical protein
VKVDRPFVWRKHHQPFNACPSTMQGRCRKDEEVDTTVTSRPHILLQAWQSIHIWNPVDSAATLLLILNSRVLSGV